MVKLFIHLECLAELHKPLAAAPAQFQQLVAASPCPVPMVEQPDRFLCMLADTELSRCLDLQKITKFTIVRLCTLQWKNLLMMMRSVNARVLFQLKITSQVESGRFHFSFFNTVEKLRRYLSVREKLRVSLWSMQLRHYSLNIYKFYSQNNFITI